MSTLLLEYQNGIYRNIHSFVTHGGVFHADDVVTTAILELLALYDEGGISGILELPAYKENAESFIRALRHDIELCIDVSPADILDVFPIPVQRLDNWEEHNVNDLPYDPENELVYDIGGGEFDHHQKDARIHLGSGRRYCALSLVYEMLMGTLWFKGIHEVDKNSFYDLLVDPVENNDVTGTLNALSVMISSFNGDVSQLTRAQRNCNFARATMLMMEMINSWFISIAKRQEDYALCAKEAQIFTNKVTGQKYAIIPKEVQNGVSMVALPDCIAVCYPSARGGYAVRSIDDKINGANFNRFSYPKIIRETHSMIEGLEFCHPAGFYGKFDNLENAQRFLESTYLVANERP